MPILADKLSDAYDKWPSKVKHYDQDQDGHQPHDQDNYNATLFVREWIQRQPTIAPSQIQERVADFMTKALYNHFENYRDADRYVQFP